MVKCFQSTGSVLLYSAVFCVLTCCSSEEKYPVIDQDFCAQIHFDKGNGLADQLAPLDSLLTFKNGVYTLEEGDNSMIARAWLCESAEQSIDIQYFIFSADNIGLIAIDYLLRAADRGVKIRMIVDDIMVEADADELLALDAHPNLSIKIYNPVANLGKNLPKKLYSLVTDFKEFNQRMHNKTFIVDGKVVITGGRNIADEYFDYDHEYNFRDRDVLLMGPVVSEINDSFELFWTSPLSIAIQDIVEGADAELNIQAAYEYVHQYACNPENYWPQVRERIKLVPIAFKAIQQSGMFVWVDSVTFVSDIPGKNDGANGLTGGGKSTDALIQLLKSANESIYIQSPYLITTVLSQQLFKEVVERGVSVKILTNSLASTDNLEAFSGYQRDREKLLKTGVEIFEFKPDAAVRFEVMTGALQKEVDFTPVFGLHAKSMVIDEKIAVIGTFNLDPRSANLNTECFTAIHDFAVAGNLFRAMETDMKPENAWETTLDFNPDDEAGWVKEFNVWLRGVVPKSIL